MQKRIISLLVSFQCFVVLPSLAITFHDDYESQSTQMFSSIEPLNQVMDYVAEVNEPLLSSGQVVFTREMQMRAVNAANQIISSVAQAHAFSASIQEVALRPDECAAALADIAVKLEQSRQLVNVFENLDVDGEDKAEAMSALAIEFMSIPFMVSEATIGMLTVCSMQPGPSN
ncbi:hypothetical protein FLL45_15615 [Aliikangiella marina]|uniref:Uncharacterized protein n=1 Tax=Aliikangiella marina TaxID=1712262 RepID=A0A545T6U3_9GAMM|nr:hypothetical protein [Aliikangiella marina]TQV72892.1 hypothetical protein FLL45_15615 [Aliikangiella marina]